MFLGEWKLLKCLYYPKLTSISVPVACLTGIENKGDLYGITEEPKHCRGRTNLESPWAVVRATVTETVRPWYENRCIDQWNRIASPEIRLHTMSTHVWQGHGGSTASSTNDAGKTEWPHGDEWNWTPSCLTPLTKVNLKWITDFKTWNCKTPLRTHRGKKLSTLVWAMIVWIRQWKQK